jgi:hypothetical protein
LSHDETYALDPTKPTSSRLKSIRRMVLCPGPTSFMMRANSITPATPLASSSAGDPGTASKWAEDDQHLVRTGRAREVDEDVR